MVVTNVVDIDVVGVVGVVVANVDVIVNVGGGGIAIDMRHWQWHGRCCG